MMSSGDEESVSRTTGEHSIIVPDDALNRVMISLTIVYGRVQLVRRRLQRDQGIDTDELEQELSQLEEAARAMVAELSGILNVSTSRKGPTPE